MFVEMATHERSNDAVDLSHRQVPAPSRGQNLKAQDQRKLKSSRSYVNCLTERIILLEKLVRESGITPPPANHPPAIARPSKSRRRSSNNKRPPKPELCSAELVTQHDLPTSSASIPDVATQKPSPNETSLVDKVLSTDGSLSFDSTTSCLRYFGPTTNFHIYSDAAGAPAVAKFGRATRESIRRGFGISAETHDYLMDEFWENYNSVIHVVHKEAFYDDESRGGTAHHSDFLHISMLAMGFRTADRSRYDIRRLSYGKRESLLHRELKSRFGTEWEKLGGVTSIQALLLLGDLECGAGRDNTGYFFSGIACRLAFDCGLNLDCVPAGLSEREIEVRHTVLWACVSYDRCWSLFLGRPTAIKPSDIAISRLIDDFQQLDPSTSTVVSEKTLESLIQEGLLDLMDLASKVTDIPRSQATSSESTARVRIDSLQRQFDLWHRRLPASLRWTVENSLTAPSSYFILHQQYHTLSILLHRPIAQFGRRDTDCAETANQSSSLSIVSRRLCVENAVKVAEIISTYRQRFDTRHLFGTTMQHAGTAASALVANISFLRSANEKNEHFEHLRILAQCLSGMGEFYAPAERMFKVLNQILNDPFGMPENEDSPDPGDTYEYAPRIPSDQLRSVSGMVGGQDSSQSWSQGFGNPRVREESAYPYNVMAEDCTSMNWTNGNVGYSGYLATDEVMLECSVSADQWLNDLLQESQEWDQQESSAMFSNTLDVSERTERFPD